MRALLNSLGLALWGSIAIVLAAGVALVGYRVSLSLRDLTPAMNAPPTGAAGNPGASAAPAASQRSSDGTPWSAQPLSDGHKISRIIGEEMLAAQSALQASQWSEALDELGMAVQKAGITAFDKFKIHDFKGFAEFKLRKYKEAQADYEAALAAGLYTPAEAARTTKLLFRVAAQNQQYAKAIEYGHHVAGSGAAAPDDLNIMAQLYYLLKDCEDTAAWADRAIAASKAAGETPKENSYELKLQCASDARDTAGMEASLIDLIKLTDKPAYWNILLRLERQNEPDDHHLLMIYRIMYGSGAMTADTDYIEMAQLLGDAALPAEAAAVLNDAMSSGIVKDEHKERVTRLLHSLQERSDSDRKRLAQQELEAKESARGNLDVKLGEIFYGFEDYQRAVDAITRGLQKGAITRIDEAYVYLGLAELRLEHFSAARQALAGLKGLVRSRTLELWALYADSAAGRQPLANAGDSR